MRIGLITNMMDANTGGIGRYVEEVVKNLLKLDKKNEYFLIHSNRKEYKFKGNFTEIKLPFFSTIPKKLLTGTWYFENICKNYNLDIIHDLGQIAPFYLRSKTKRILTVFDLTSVLFPENISIKSKLIVKLYPRVYSNTDKIITISESAKKDLINLYKIPEEKIIVTPLGADKKFRRITDNTALMKVKKKYHLPENFLLFVGTIEPRKNLENLIKAYSPFKNRNTIKLVIVGKKGWKYDPFFQTIKKLDLEKDVLLTGFVDDNDLPYFYNLAKVFVYPSFYEGFGLPVLEAMACGCPIITSNTSSFPEIVGNAGIMINPYSLENELIPALQKIFYNLNYRNNLIKKGFLQAKKFNWKNCAEKTLNVYQSLTYD